ncbi:MAG: thiamine diphosphokinase [Bacteroidales bacterium]|nr:thiamine diphosphokinase [Bacteroidales bacterium]
MSAVVILAAGDFPSSDKTLGILASAQTLICCDSAATEAIERGFMPDFIIGDMDSLPEHYKSQFGDRIIEIREQDDNDLTKAFNFSLNLNPSHIHILGGTGRREDHTLGNIGHLADFASLASCPVEMVSDWGRFIATDGRKELTFTSHQGEQISIFAFDNTLKIHSDGLLYPTDDVRFDNLWQATLNEALSESFSLTLSHPAKVLVYFAW